MWGRIKKKVHKNHNPECISQEQKQCTHISRHLHRPWTHPEQVTFSLTIFRALVCDSFIQQRLQLTIIQVGHIRILVFCLQTKCNFLLMNSVTQVHEYRFIIHNINRQMKVAQNEQWQNDLHSAAVILHRQSQCSLWTSVSSLETRINHMNQDPDRNGGGGGGTVFFFLPWTAGRTVAYRGGGLGGSNPLRNLKFWQS